MSRSPSPIAFRKEVVSLFQIWLRTRSQGSGESVAGPTIGQIVIASGLLVKAVGLGCRPCSEQRFSAQLPIKSRYQSKSSKKANKAHSTRLLTVLGA